MTTSDSSAQERSTQYVRVLPTGEEEMITQDVAEAEGTYMAYRLIDSEIESIELVEEGRTDLVVYHNREWPDRELLAAHWAGHGRCRMTVLTAVALEDGRPRRRSYEIGEDGLVTSYDELTLDERGEPIREVRRDANGTFIEVLEYEYDADGEIALTRVIGSDGTVLDEWES